jgi:hypothetical protein
MRVDKIAHMSMSHISKRTREHLRCGQIKPDLIYETWGGYGWIILCSSEYAEAVTEYADLYILIEHCLEQGIEWLKLDCDEDVDPRFPIYTGE